MSFDIVVPTIGRPSLGVLLERLAASSPGGGDWQIFVVDDRAGAAAALDGIPASLAGRVRVLRGGGRGPAHARNVGWRASRAEWIAFLDDDVLAGETWFCDVAADIAAAEDAGPECAASFARIVVPLPRDRRPTDWERNVARLETAEFITADAAFRRSALAAVDGFDERFPRAYREDADLALRLQARGRTFARGARTTLHPVRPASPWISVRLQRGNADDALMERLHGERWQRSVRHERAVYLQHERAVSAVLDAALAGLRGRRETALGLLGVWAATTGLFALRRILPGPWTAREVGTMLATSLAIPFAAVWHRLAGERATAGSPLPAWSSPAAPLPVKAVLFDRDGTLVVDAPIGGDARRVAEMPFAAEALARLAEARIGVGVVTNQPGLGRGAFSASDHDAVCARIAEVVGPIGVWAVCEHPESAGCECRKPKPALVLRAARALGVRPEECVVIGDIGSDVEAARAAGARSILVPTPVTRAEEVASAPCVAADLQRAIDLVLAGPSSGARARGTAR